MQIERSKTTRNVSLRNSKRQVPLTSNTYLRSGNSETIESESKKICEGQIEVAVSKTVAPPGFPTIHSIPGRKRRNSSLVREASVQTAISWVAKTTS